MLCDIHFFARSFLLVVFSFCLVSQPADTSTCLLSVFGEDENIFLQSRLLTLCEFAKEKMSSSGDFINLNIFLLESCDDGLAWKLRI